MTASQGVVITGGGVERNNNITFISFISKDSDRSILSDSSEGDSVESDTEESRSSAMSGLSVV
jgi:hypothetical protein